MKITVIGSGYVGLVTGACLAEMGNHVVCLDVDARKIEMLQRGEIPIHEPGLKEVVQRNAAAGRLQFTTDQVAAAAHGTLQFIGVGTPPDEDGSADLQYVLAAARNIGRHMTGVPKEIQLRQICHFFRADPAYGMGVAKALQLDLREFMPSTATSAHSR